MKSEQITASQVGQFEKDGFLNAGKVLDEATVDGLSDELDRIIAIGPAGFKDAKRAPVSFTAIGGDADRPVWQIVDIWMASPLFEKLIHHPYISTAIGAMPQSSNLQIWHDQ